MKVRLSGPAWADLRAAFEFVYSDSPPAAQDVYDAIMDAVQRLGSLSNRGRVGRIPGTRELVITKTGHVAAYVVRPDEVIVVRIRHGRQEWPAQ